MAGTIALHAFLFVGGLTVALLASDRAVGYARSLAAQLRAPAFMVGVVLVGIGTDLPEIANSIAAHVEGEGDVNVGDSVGSALTQYTLVLGVFPFVAGTLIVSRRQVGVVSVFIIGGLATTAAFVADGNLSRWEGVALVSAWFAFVLVIARTVSGLHVDEPPAVKFATPAVQTGIVLVALVLVAFGATVAVRSLVRMAELAGVPEFVIAFFGASFGTSAPEIVVGITALLRGAPAIALGDALGASLADSTLSVGIGPVVAPAAVTPRLAVVGSLYSVLAVAIVGSLLAGRRRHDRRSGLALFSLYALAYIVLLAARA